jgi:ribbon-helix-helix CopG family protein
VAKKLHLALGDHEYRQIERLARERGISVSEWVEQAIDVARREESSGDSARKLAAVRAAVRHCSPTGDIENMLAEIERGYSSD